MKAESATEELISRLMNVRLWLSWRNRRKLPVCSNTDIRRIRRITGYLSSIDRFNDAKKAELKDRRPHK